MTISVIQAILIGLLYYLGINGTPWKMCIRDRRSEVESDEA